GIGLQPRNLGERVQRTDPSGAPADRVEAHVGRDLVQPGPELRVTLEPLPAPPRPQVRLLHGVLGLVERRQHPVAVHVELAPVPFGPRLELLRDDDHQASWRTQTLPSGSRRSANELYLPRAGSGPDARPSGPKWKISATSTPRRTNSARAASMSATTRCKPFTV